MANLVPNRENCTASNYEN